MIGGGYQPDHAALVERHVCLHQAAHNLMPQLAQCGRVAKLEAATFGNPR